MACLFGCGSFEEVENSNASCMWATSCASAENPTQDQVNKTVVPFIAALGIAAEAQAPDFPPAQHLKAAPLYRQLWQSLELNIKIKLAERLRTDLDTAARTIEEPIPQNGSMVIQVNESPLKIDWEFKNSGAFGSVYIFRINDGEKFAIKLLIKDNPLIEPVGKSARILLNHSIDGIVPLWGIDQFAFEDTTTGYLVAMDALEYDWEIGAIPPYDLPFEEKLNQCFSMLESLGNAAHVLQKQYQLSPEDISIKNLMLDKQRRPYIIDIDNLIKRTPSNDWICYNQLLDSMANIFWQCKIRSPATYNSIAQNLFLWAKQAGYTGIRAEDQYLHFQTIVTQKREETRQALRNLEQKTFGRV